MRKGNSLKWSGAKNTVAHAHLVDKQERGKQSIGREGGEGKSVLKIIIELVNPRYGGSIARYDRHMFLSFDRLTHR